MYIDLRNNYAKADDQISQEIFITALECLDEASLNGKFLNFKLSTLHDTALYVGHILGEYLYEHVFNKSTKLNFEQDFLNTSPDNFSFQRIKKILLKGTSYKKHQKRYF